MITYRIAKCLVEVSDRTVTTRFPDGAVLYAEPDGTEEQAQCAADLGYPDVEALTRDHDVLHTLLAEAQHRDYSPTLHAAAIGQDYIGAQEEERVVMLLHRLSQGTLADILSRKVQSVDLDTAARILEDG